MLIKRFRENYEDKSLEDLIKERNNVIKQIKEYEEKFIFDDPKYGEVMYSKPSPKTIYSVNNEDLIMLTQLIIEKSN